MAFYYSENPSSYFFQDEYIFQGYSTDPYNNIYGEVMEVEEYPSHQEEVWEQEESGWIGRELESGEGDSQWFEGDGEFREEPGTQEWVEEGAEWGYEEPEENQWIRAHWYGDEEQETPYGEPTSPQGNHYTIHHPPAVETPNWNHQNAPEQPSFTTNCKACTRNPKRFVCKPWRLDYLFWSSQYQRTHSRPEQDTYQRLNTRYSLKDSW